MSTRSIIIAAVMERIFGRFRTTPKPAAIPQSPPVREQNIPVSYEAVSYDLPVTLDTVDAPREVELTEEDRLSWEEAYVGEKYLRGQTYTIALDTTEGSPVRLYGVLETDSFGSQTIKVPMVGDYTSEELAKDAYLSATFFGEIDQEKFSAFVTDQFRQDSLLAYLNQQSVIGEAQDVYTWFQERVSDPEDFTSVGPIFFSTSGGAIDMEEEEIRYTNTVSIQARDKSTHYLGRYETREESLQKAHALAATVNASLPHLQVTPIPVSAYRGEIARTLPFLPKDWPQE